jgi:tetratricopeptide (TPR) repeat protein
MARFSYDDLYRDAVRTQYFKNDPEGGLRKLVKIREDMMTGAVEDTPLIFRIPARIAILNDNFADARSHTEAGLLFFGEDSDLILLLATCEIAGGNYPHAFQLVDEALDKTAADDSEIRAIAYLLRGDAWGRQRKFALQVEEYKRALEQHSKFPLAFELIGHALLETGKFPEARDAFRKASAQGITMPWSLLGYGIALKNLGDLRSAVSEFYKITDSFKQDEILYRAHRQLGSCFYRRKEYDKAREHYTRALEHVHNDVPTLCDLTVICMESGEYDDASNFLAMAVKGARNATPASRDVVERGLASLGTLTPLAGGSGGIRSFRVSTDPVATSFAYLLAGLLFESQEKYSDSKFLYDRVLSVSPDASHRAEAVRRIGGLEEFLKGMYAELPEEPRKRQQETDKPSYVNISRFRRSSFRR